MAEVNNNNNSLSNDNLTEFSSGLYSDASPLYQPKGTQRFALNMVNEESMAGDQRNPGSNTAKNNEGSNELYINLPSGHIPIGKVYVENNETLIFSVKEDNSKSAIGIMDDYGKYIPMIETEVLNFKVEHQIQATYRLRRGCEKTVYWTDDFNPPRQVYWSEGNYDFDAFKDEAGNWSERKFDLIKVPTQIPNFEKIDVVEGGGSLNPGSYTIAVQYIDENYNATNWLNSTDSVVIYNSLLSDSYHNIGGSFFNYAPVANGDNPLSMGKTSKAIRVELSNLDKTFPFYRLGFSIADSGTGFATKAVATEAISTSNTTYILSSLTNTSEIALEELVFEKAQINKAKTIEQHENLLLLGNTTGWEGNLCRFQKFASKIKADCIVTDANGTDANVCGNIKNPALNVSDVMGGAGAGYMPGEIYSFGIVYILKSGFITPVFHIPGKAPGDDLTKKVFYKEEGVETFPMSNIKNMCEQSRYSPIGSCNNSDFWGYDSEGNLLQGKQIRHHKFPDRKDIKKPLVQVEGELHSTDFVRLILTLTTTYKHNFAQDSELGREYPDDIQIKYSYRVFDADSTLIKTVTDKVAGNSGTNLFLFTDGISGSNEEGKEIQITSPNMEGKEIIVDSVTITYYKRGTITDSETGEEREGWVKVTDEVVSESGTTITYNPEVSSSESFTGLKHYTVNKLGIVFSNIEVPTAQDLGIDDEVIGYYIVRNKRDEDNKIIVDSGVMTPTYQADSDAQALGYDKYIAPSLLMPQDTISVKKLPVPVLGIGEPNKYFWNIITPRNKFIGTKLMAGLYTIEQQGYYERTSGLGGAKYSRTRYSDVMEGSSYGSSENKDKLSNQNMDEGDAAGNPHKKGLDGWCFKMACRDNILNYKTINNGFTILPDQQKKIYTLRGMEYEPTEQDPTACIYNSQTDNINQILEFNKDNMPDGLDYDNTLPYVIIKKDVLEPYATFYTLPYYKDTTNVQPVKDKDGNPLTVCKVFNGDSYISSLRYTSVVKYRNNPVELLAKAQLSSWVAWLVIAFSMIAAAVVTIFTGGAATPIVIAGVAAALTLVGGGIWAATSVLENQKWIQNYESAYEDGLQKTVNDAWTRAEFEGDIGLAWHGGNYDSPSDDQLEYAADCLTDIWFESEINMGLRVKGPGDLAFLGSPGKIEDGLFWGELVQTVKDGYREAFKSTVTIKWLMTRNVGSPQDKQGSYREPKSTLENFSNNKCLIPNLDRNHGKEFTGTAVGEAYIINPDLQRRGGVNTYYHLPLTYDCCSDCKENFPHRFHWSEQSFQEEIVDNYSLFKENNYKDLDGETGEIINIFKIRNQLFVHTREALWEVPKNHQEVVTDQIVSFIGTGSLYDIPPRKIVEGQSGMSAGLWHRESALLTEHGYFFVCEKQRKIFYFNGQQLQAISDNGISDWFKDNIELKMSADYRKANGRNYQYDDNPSNKYGCGFISTYDSYKNRILFTKKDFQFKNTVIGSDDFELCVRDGVLIISRNHNQTINEIITPQPDPTNPQPEWSDYHQELVYPITGWRYLGIEDCQLKFERDIRRQKEDTRWEFTKIQNDAIIIFNYDNSGSMTSFELYNFKRNFVRWYMSFRPEDVITQVPVRPINGDSSAQIITTENFDYFFPPDATEDEIKDTIMSSLYADTSMLKHSVSTSSDEEYYGERYLKRIAKAGDTYNDKNVVYIDSVNEVTRYDMGFDSDALTMRKQPTQDYVDDYALFIDAYENKFKSFIGLMMPAAPDPNGELPEWLSYTLAFIQHIIGAVYGRNLQQSEFDSIPPNLSYTPAEWTSISTALINNNPYTDELSLKKYNFSFMVNKSLARPPTPEDFARDIETLLADIEVELEIKKTVNYTDIDYMYLPGEEVHDAIQHDNSWTLSYDLNSQKWVSWHSYLPSMYFYVANKFYSWLYGQTGIWKHNKVGHYQTYYGELYPFIVDYISISNPLQTRVFDAIQLICDAEIYDSVRDEFTDIDTYFFNKVIAYNSRQCTGELNIKVKNEDLNQNYLMEQVDNTKSDEIIADKNEKIWSLNNLRDIRTDYSQPIFDSNPASKQPKYFIDKVLNVASMDINKDWNELESLRDKYLAVRFIFDKFANIKLALNFSSENEKMSAR